MASSQFSTLDYWITFGLLLVVLGMAGGLWWPSCGALRNALVMNQLSPYLLLTLAHCDDPGLRLETLARVAALPRDHPLVEQLLNQLAAQERDYFLEMLSKGEGDGHPINGFD